MSGYLTMIKKKLILIDGITSVKYELPGWLRKLEVGRGKKENGLTIPDKGYRDSLDKTKQNLLDQIATQVLRKTHFILYQEGEDKKIAACKATNSVFLNDEQLPYGIKFPLVNYDKIRLGDYRLEVRIEEVK